MTEHTSRLAGFIERNDIRSIPILSHSVNMDGKDGWHASKGDYDVFDILLIINAGPNLYGSMLDHRTMLVRGYGQAASLNQPRNDGELTPPTTREVLADAVSIAQDIDAYPVVREWLTETYAGSITTADDLLNALDAREQAQRIRNDLITFFGGPESTENFGLYAQAVKCLELDNTDA